MCIAYIIIIKCIYKAHFRGCHKCAEKEIAEKEHVWPCDRDMTYDLDLDLWTWPGDEPVV